MPKDDAKQSAKQLAKKLVSLPKTADSFSNPSDGMKKFINKHPALRRDDANGNGDDVFNADKVKKDKTQSSRVDSQFGRDIQVGEEYVQERELTTAEAKKKEKFAKAMKPVSKWVDRYGKRGENVMYATATKMAKEEVDLDEASNSKVSVKNQKYSWGNMITVHRGSETSFPLHPEHQTAIKKLNDGEKTKFKDETGAHVIAHREGDKINLSHVSRSGVGETEKTTVNLAHFNEEVELDEAVVDHERYERSHGKKASGNGTWMFTNKPRGPLADYDDETKVHRYNGKFGDAKKSAIEWAKKHGHHTAYVMEETELDEVSLAPYPGEKWKDQAVMVHSKTGQRTVIDRKNIKNYSTKDGWKEVAPGMKVRKEETELDEGNKENKQKKNEYVASIIQKKLHPSVLPSLKYGRRELKKEETYYVIHKKSGTPGEVSSRAGENIAGVTIKDKYPDRKEASAHAKHIDKQSLFRNVHGSKLGHGVGKWVNGELQEEVDEVDEGNKYNKLLKNMHARKVGATRMRDHGSPELNRIAALKKGRELMKNSYEPEGEELDEARTKKSSTEVKPVNPKDLLVPLASVSTKPPRGHKQYNPRSDFPGVKVLKNSYEPEGEEVVAESLDTHEMAMAHKNKASKALETSDMKSFHHHMANHYESMGQWHESKGRHSAADREYAKAEEHHEKSLKPDNSRTVGATRMQNEDSHKDHFTFLRHIQKANIPIAARPSKEEALQLVHRHGDANRAGEVYVRRYQKIKNAARKVQKEEVEIKEQVLLELGEPMSPAPATSDNPMQSSSPTNTGDQSNKDADNDDNDDNDDDSGSDSVKQAKESLEAVAMSAAKLYEDIPDDADIPSWALEKLELAKNFLDSLEKEIGEGSGDDHNDEDEDGESQGEPAPKSKPTAFKGGQAAMAKESFDLSEGKAKKSPWEKLAKRLAIGGYDPKEVLSRPAPGNKSAAGKKDGVK